MKSATANKFLTAKAEWLKIGAGKVRGDFGVYVVGAKDVHYSGMVATVESAREIAADASRLSWAKRVFIRQLSTGATVN